MALNKFFPNMVERTAFNLNENSADIKTDYAYCEQNNSSYEPN